ncbi:MAG: hypothetical protein GY856_38470 [bacterium]|nr:hypothetical protein [bacterium]
MKWISVDDVRSWYAGSPGAGARGLNELLATVGHRPVEREFITTVLGIPLHLAAVTERLAQEGSLSADRLDSIPFYSLCRGLFLPLTAMTPEKAAQLFGLRIDPPPSSAEREALLRRFMTAELGLSPLRKVACLLGDPCEGRPSTFRRESLLGLLLSLSLRTRRELLDRLTVTGDVAVLYAESRPSLRHEPPLTSAEVLETLRFLPEERRSTQFQILRSVVERCGKLEAYFLAKLILGKAGLRYEGELLAQLLGERFGVAGEQVSQAMALTDAFAVTRVLESEGAPGLRTIQLQPLVPVRPALASGGAEGIRTYPVWVERKYDGIRLLLHKTTDRLGSVLCGAYSRNRRDYLELVRGLDATIKMLPAGSLIIDGELCGTLPSAGGMRPATVYELFGSLQGESALPIRLRYAAFDLLYLNGRDLTAQPLAERRQPLAQLVGPLAAFPLPIELTVAEGQMANSKEDVNRLYQHFRSQGYEGIITKDLTSPYRLAARDPGWLKRKPEITLELVLLGAVLAVTTKEKAGMFGSYVIGARSPESGFEDVGDVAGVDRVRDAEIQQVIMSEGLLTGRRIERRSASGTRPGFELVPHIVVTVRFEGVIRDSTTGRLSLRDPKLVVIRPDKAAHEADSTPTLEELYLKQKVG